MGSGLVAGPFAGTGNAMTFSTGVVPEASQFEVIGAMNPDLAHNYDGNNEHALVDAPYIPSGNELTVEAWIYVSGSINYITQASENSDNMSTNVWILGDGAIPIFYVNDGGTWRSAVNPGSNPVANGWHHFAGVASASSTQLYIDGVLAATGPGVSSGIQSNSMAKMAIGRDVRFATGTANRMSANSYDEVRV